MKFANQQNGNAFRGATGEETSRVAGQAALRPRRRAGCSGCRRRRTRSRGTLERVVAVATGPATDGASALVADIAATKRTIPSPAQALAGGQLLMIPSKLTVDSELAAWLEDGLRALTYRRVDGSLLRHCLIEGITGPDDGLVAEFGVFTANSLRTIASSMPTRTVYGFDSFQGFQEDWDLASMKVSKEFFSVRDPRAAGDNVELVKGYFSESLPRFLRAHREPFGFVHIDCDMYSSTRDIFEIAGDRFRAGTVVVFDEFFCHDAEQKGEFTAFYEWTKRTGARFEFIGVGDGSHELMTRIPKLSEPLFVDRLAAALLFRGLKVFRGKDDFITAVAVRIL